jgi:hypothetical protein
MIPSSLIRISIAFLIGLSLWSCQYGEQVELSLLRTPPKAAAIENDTVFGYVSGRMLADSTYYVTGNLLVLPNDSLIIEEGATVLVTGNYSFFVSGHFRTEGTQTKPIFLTVTDDLKTTYPDGGAWGGISLDTAQSAIIRWTHIQYAGGPDNRNDPRYGISVLNDQITPFILEDSWIENTLDDGIRLYGTQNVSIQRNSFLRNGGPEGEAINIQLGVTGIFAYNEIFSSATNCMKIYTDNAVKFPQTKLQIYNNTYFNTGYRRLQKPGNAILLDRFAQANIHNNIFVNCKQSLRMTKICDTTNTTYGNNLFYADLSDANLESSTIAKFYPVGDWGKIKSTDLMNVDPLFVSFSNDLNGTQNLSNVKLQSGSPCIGAGNSIYNDDIGCYTTDNRGNKH